MSSRASRPGGDPATPQPPIGRGESSERIGLVLAGGGARGAYEAGALTVLLPVLEREGRLPSVIVGTSVGAINAVHLAASIHLGAERATALMAERWRAIGVHHVLRPLVPERAPRTALLYLAEVLGVPGVTLRSLLDPAPLERTLDEWLDWAALRENLESGRVAALGAVATSAASERSVVFLDGGSCERPYDSHGIDYVPARLESAHIRASAAIPTLFPAVRVDRPAAGAGWYFDGGTRLNTPLKPVLDLGVDRVAVVATHSLSRDPEGGDGEQPDFADGAVELVQATLVDPLIEDLRMLGKINLLVDEGLPRAFTDYRARRGKAPYRPVPHAVVAPPERRELGRAALATLRERYSGLGRLRSPDLSLIGRLAGGRSEQQGELLSYLFFEGDFADRLIALGRRDARLALGDGDTVGWELAPPSPPSAEAR